MSAVEFKIASKEEQDAVAKKYNWFFDFDFVCIAKKDSEIIGFAGFCGNTLAKIKVDKPQRKSTVANELISFTLKQFFQKYPHATHFRFIPGAEIGVGQLRFEKWTRQKGAFPNPLKEGEYVFARPLTGETFHQARKRELARLARERLPILPPTPIKKLSAPRTRISGRR